MRRAARTLGWPVALAVALTMLHRLGNGALGAPPLALDGLPGWIAERDPATSFFAVLRLVALGLASYLALVTVAAFVARLIGSARALRWVDVVTAPAVRPLIRSVVAAGVTGASIVPATVVVAAPTPPSTAVEVDSGSGTATLRRLPPDADDEAARPETPTAPAPGTWTVQPGDHLWRVAEQTLARSWHRDPTEAETARYWRDVVDRNRRRLPDPANPDLVFAGLVIDLPPTHDALH